LNAWQVCHLRVQRCLRKLNTRIFVQGIFQHCYAL